MASHQKEIGKMHMFVIPSVTYHSGLLMIVLHIPFLSVSLLLPKLFLSFLSLRIPLILHIPCTFSTALHFISLSAIILVWYFVPVLPAYTFGMQSYTLR